jgi:ComF family protein
MMHISDLLMRLIDSIAPPRVTDTLVRNLGLQELRAITLRGEKGGSLPYHDPRVTAMVWELKYFAHKRAAALAGELLSDVLKGVAAECLGIPLLIPIPMHAARRRIRGHNQTELLCEAALQHLQGFYEYKPQTLSRIKATPQQQGLHRDQRERNLTHSMKARPEMARGRVCVVIDDVSTTGATFTEATRALQAAGASQIICVALAYS